MSDMKRIPGYYEWDDDSLTPGKKKEGGLHQNLYDSEGKLRKSARFVELDHDFSDPIVVTETVYVPVEERRRNIVDEELAELIEELVFALLDRGTELAKPHVQHWWRESVQPFVGKQWSRLRKRPVQNVEPKLAAEIVQEAATEVSTDLAPQAAERPKMSSGEAQARMLAAMAAHAFANEQVSLVDGAEIIGDKDADGVRESIAKLPPEDLTELVKRMVMNPSLLEEKSLAELASILAGETANLDRQLNAPEPDEDSSR